ncbi:hypothetical protein Shyd_88580 [Streptomyces hydrogenans]|uniref:Uncharacterized protein n=1 Tax=Streptomyces hydrogenans TaxID=1873719 RepID=A0ABQ3PR41_9ACTN|nr:hypothetical protein Shyd_88580 [Streptomyces hydrogenans]
MAGTGRAVSAGRADGETEGMRISQSQALREEDGFLAVRAGSGGRGLRGLRDSRRGPVARPSAPRLARPLDRLTSARPAPRPIRRR